MKLLEIEINSGIVIENVGSASGDTITFDIKFTDSNSQDTVEYSVENDKQKHKKAKGKKGLTINASGSGTGVNI